jgi:hypothetical protein
MEAERPMIRQKKATQVTDGKPQSSNKKITRIPKTKKFIKNILKMRRVNQENAEVKQVSETREDGKGESK